MCGGVHDVIAGNKLHQNWSRGFRATGSENWGLPLTWIVALATVKHYRADCDKVDDMLLTSLRQSDILQGCHLHMVSWYLAQKLWSLLNRSFVFGLCWNYDCVLSPLELLFWIWCLLDKWSLLRFFNNICFCQPSLLAPIFHHCSLVLPVAAVCFLHQFLPQLFLVKLIISWRIY